MSILFHLSCNICFLDRYFIIIDDLWDTQSWQIIKMALVDNNCGSRLITTTRNLEVAKEAGVVYNLRPLSSFYWKELLFTRILHSGINFLDNLQDDQLTDKILKKCGGIPLATITKGAMARSVQFYKSQPPR